PPAGGRPAGRGAAVGAGRGCGGRLRRGVGDRDVALVGRGPDRAVARRVLPDAVADRALVGVELGGVGDVRVVGQDDVDAALVGVDVDGAGRGGELELDAALVGRRRHPGGPQVAPLDPALVAVEDQLAGHPGDLDRGLVGLGHDPALDVGHGDRPPGRHLDAQPGGHLDRVVDLAPVAADERAAAADLEAVALDLHAVAGGPQPLADAGPDGHLVGALDPHDLDRPGAVVDVEHGDAVGVDGPHL